MARALVLIFHFAARAELDTHAKAKIGIFTALLKEMLTRRMLPSSKGMQSCCLQRMTLHIGHKIDPPMCELGIAGTLTKCCVTSAHDTCAVKEVHNSYLLGIAFVRDCTSKVGCLEAVNWISIGHFLYDSVRQLAEYWRGLVRRVFYVIVS